MKVGFAVELEKSILIQSLQRLAEKHSLPIEFQALQNETEDFDLKIVKLQFFDLNEELPAVIEPRAGSLRCYDTLIKQGEFSIPRLSLLEALNSAIVRYGHDFDIRKSAYVIASSYQGLVCAAVCAQLGFQKIVLVDDDMDRSLTSTKILKRSYFGLETKSITSDLITAQREPGSIVINSVELSDHSNLLSDLSYFNFVAQNGVIVDISSESANSPLLKDVVEANLRSVNSLQFLSELVRVYWQYLSREQELPDEDLEIIFKNPTTV